MLQIFRNNRVVNYIFLILYASLLRLAVFIYPEPYTPNSTGVITDWIYQSIGTSGFIPDLLALVLVIIQAFLLNTLVSNYKISYSNSMFPGVFYILICSLYRDFLHLSPVLIGNTFLIIALFQLFQVYKRKQVAGFIFNVGFWIAIASLCYFSFLVYIPMGLVGLNILRNVRANELFIFLIACITPYFLLGTGYFWYDQLDLLFQVQILNNYKPFDWQYAENWLSYAKWAIFLIAIILLLVSYGLFGGRKSLQAQKNINILLSGLFFTFFSFFFQYNIQLEHMLLTAVPMGVFSALHFLSIRNQQWADVLHLLILFVVFILQYLPN